MSKLLFFDVDGTLVTFDGKMPESTLDALKKAKENGHKCFICTGRSYNQIYNFLFEQFEWDGVVAAAGGYVECDGKELSHDVFGEELLGRIMEVVKQSKMAIIGQTKHNCVAKKEWGEAFLESFVKKGDDVVTRNDPTFLETTYDEDIDNYPSKYADMESIIFINSEIVVNDLIPMLGDEIEVTLSSFKEPEPRSGEITLKKVNKASGMQCIMDYLGVGVENTIGFGDGANDIDMLKFAGVGVAMGNAQDCAKEAADMVADNIENDGLKKAMDELGLI